MELLTSKQMRAVEKAAIDSGSVSGVALMERAGQGVVDALMRRWPNLEQGAHRALVLCGPGNNGGDGFVTARVLAARGWMVDVLFYGARATLSSDAAHNHDLWAEHAPVLPFELATIRTLSRPDVLIDALFGIGLTRPLPDVISGVLDETTSALWQDGAPVRVAVDCPSGLDLDTGYMREADFTRGLGAKPGRTGADLTVTFHTPKPGHYLAQGPALCGALDVVDIGLETGGGERASGKPAEPRTRLSAATGHGARRCAHGRSGWPMDLVPKVARAGHKYDFGHAMVFAGGVGRGGAARLAARAALRVGAGLVTMVTPKSALIENAMHLNAVMLRALDDPERLAEVADERVSAFCLGPGLGVGGRTRELIRAVLSRDTCAGQDRPPAVVLDADALTSFEADPAELFALLHARVILTPHAGEFARLFPEEARYAQRRSSKIDAARAAAMRAGCTILLKGPDTVIATPQGETYLNAAVYERAVPWLATAGAGDVLAGMITGLLAVPGVSDIGALADVAAWLHVECARSFGPGLIAEDLPEELPKIFRSLGA